MLTNDHVILQCSDLYIFSRYSVSSFTVQDIIVCSWESIFFIAGFFWRKDLCYLCFKVFSTWNPENIVKSLGFVWKENEVNLKNMQNKMPPFNQW